MAEVRKPHRSTVTNLESFQSRIDRDQSLMAGCRCFVRCQRNDSQGVDVCLHQVVQEVIHYPVSLYRGLIPERIRNNAHSKVATAFLRARVPGVLMAVVENLELNGFEFKEA